MAFVADLNRLPIVTDQTGPPETVVVNMAATIERFQEYPEHVVYDVTGPRGTTQVMIQPGNTGQIEAIYLIVDGEVQPIER